MAQEELTLARVKLSKLRVISPQSGVVIAKKIEDGQAVGLGEPLFVVADIDSLEIEVEIDEVDIPKVKVGQTAIITSEGLPDCEFKAKVVKIAPQAEIKENATVVKTTLRLNSSGNLKIGNQVDVKIITDRKSDILTLPLGALIEEEGKSFVFVYSGGMAKKEEVTTGISSIDQIEIISGLKEGDEIIIPHGLNLRDQDRVRKKTK
ncbi:MAG: efflux RND transporter periplasmic adaptor subunit [bacterium]|nr:efflux RND transporter periplasmic adaptor subunit [bacterium]